MIQGGLIKVLDKRLKGDFYHTSSVVNAIFDGFTTGRETIPIDLPKPVENDVVNVILEVGVLSQSTRIDWRLRVNGFNVTKEFKPLVSTRIGGIIFTKHVYDITSLVTSSESKGRRYVNVTIRRDGGEPFVVKHIDLCVIYDSEDADSKVAYYSGGLMIEPGGRFSFKTIGVEDHILSSTFIAPSGASTILVKTKNGVDTVAGVTDVKRYSSTIRGSDEVEFENASLKDSTQKPIVLSNLVMYRVSIAKPRIIVEKVEYRDGFLTVRVRNIGESKPDQAILTILSHGTTMHVCNIPLLASNEEHEVSIPIKLPPGERELCVRAIWRKISKMETFDYKYKVNIV